MYKQILKILTVFVTIVALSACGFHLRGNIPLSEGIKVMFVDGPDGSFKDVLEQVLANGGAEIESSKSSADVVLRILKLDTDRIVGTIDDRGKADSYTLKLNVRYALQDPEAKNIRPPKSISESRRFNFDPELVIESESEEEELLSSMEQDLALRIVRQLSTITDYPSK